MAEQLGRRVAPVPLLEGHRGVADSWRASTRRSDLRGDTRERGPLGDRRPAPRDTRARGNWCPPARSLTSSSGWTTTSSSPSPPTNHRFRSPTSPPHRWRGAHCRVQALVTVLATGRRCRARFDVAVREWKVLMAAAQTGVAQGALDLAIEYAKEREAFGVPIGAFQAISHAIVDIAVGVEGSRSLARRAAWYCDHDAGARAEPALVASLHARDVANRAASVGIHVQGGFGFTLESDLQLYFRRAKGWTVVSGDAARRPAARSATSATARRSDGGANAWTSAPSSSTTISAASGTTTCGRSSTSTSPTTSSRSERHEGNGFVPEYQRTLAARGWLEPLARRAADTRRARPRARGGARVGAGRTAWARCSRSPARTGS